MMSNEGYRDRILTCRDCGNEFTFTAGEQEFFASKGLSNPPGRCPTCRAARRGQQSNGGGARAPRGEQYDAICAACGRPTTVPFMPREDRPVYCSDCFQSQRASRRPREESHSSSYSFSYNDTSYGGGGGGGGRERRGGRDRDRRDSRDNRRDRRDNRWDDRW